MADKKTYPDFRPVLPGARREPSGKAAASRPESGTSNPARSARILLPHTRSAFLDVAFPRRKQTLGRG